MAEREKAERVAALAARQISPIHDQEITLKSPKEEAKGGDVENENRECLVTPDIVADNHYLMQKDKLSEVLDQRSDGVPDDNPDKLL